jgi:gliding motility-associated lipoprotein GldH
MKKYFIVAAAALLSFAACENYTAFDAARHIGSEGWHKDSIVSFDFTIDDTTAFYAIFINLRNTTAYPYCNLFLFIKTTAPSGAFVCDTVEYILTDSYGKWLGRGFSKIIDNRMLYKEMVQFPSSGAYRMEIVQGMRMYLLPEIINIGVKIERTSP